MATFPPAMMKLIAELAKLPTVGEKSATRLAYHLVSKNRDLANSLALAMQEAVRQVGFCERCFFLAQSPLCSICSNAARDTTTLCVVEKPMDVIAIERLGDFKGLYHVLHGLWAPLKGQGPESMRIAELRKRLLEGGIKEVIVATGATVEGDATALYVARIVSEQGIPSTRLAQGMPKGGELEYADDVTLSRAFSGRSRISA